MYNHPIKQQHPATPQHFFLLWDVEEEIETSESGGLFSCWRIMEWANIYWTELWLLDISQLLLLNLDESVLHCEKLLGCAGSKSNHPTQSWQHHPITPICLDNQDKNSLQGQKIASAVYQRFENFSCTTKRSSTRKCTFWHMVGPCTFLYSSALL